MYLFQVVIKSVYKLELQIYRNHPPPTTVNGKCTTAKIPSAAFDLAPNIKRRQFALASVSILLLWAEKIWIPKKTDRI